MAIVFQCPSCGRRLKVSSEKAGRSGKCPGCGETITIPGEAAAPPRHQEDTEFSPPAFVSSPVPEPPPRQTPPEFLAPSPGPQMASYSNPGPVFAPPIVAVQVRQSRVHSSLGVASIILGILALLICWIPLLNVLGLPLGLLGILLGGIGFVVAVVRKGAGIGLPIAGTAISLLATWVIVAMYAAVAGAVAELSKPPQVLTGEKAALEVNGAPAPGPANGGAALGPRQEKIDWHDARRPLRIGNVELRVVSANVGKVPLKDIMNEDSSSVDDFLMVTLQITNLDPARKLDYRTWRGRDFSFERDFAALEDNFGNRYKRIGFSIGSRPKNGIDSSESIYPQRTIEDVLVFEPPVENVEYLTLELPGANIGMDGVIKIRIPKEMIGQ